MLTLGLPQYAYCTVIVAFAMMVLIVGLVVQFLAVTSAVMTAFFVYPVAFPPKLEVEQVGGFSITPPK
jgi:hypothetical protein